MLTKVFNGVKPLFFIHTIDPINWPFLYLFVRPFFNIVCYQYNRVRPQGFQRLSILSLSSEEFKQANLQGLQFAKDLALADTLNIFYKVGQRDLDLSKYFAKDYLRYVTDLCLSAKMITKLDHPNGVFVLSGLRCHRQLEDKTRQWFKNQSQLKWHRLWDGLIRSWYNPVCGVLKFVMTLVGFFAIIIKKIEHTRRNGRIPISIGKERFIYITYIPAELESDCLRKLSAGFFIDGKQIRKEDVLFLSRECLEAVRWRKEGYCVHSIFDFIDTRLFLKAVFILGLSLLRQPRALFQFLILMSPKQFINMLFCELFVAAHQFRGVMYTNSEAATEPMISTSFLARQLPVILFYYSASTFAHPMWGYLQANHVYVWNEGMIPFLKLHPQSGERDYHVAGPLMQVEDHFTQDQLRFLQNEFKIIQEPQLIKVGVFDIAALKSDALEESRLVQYPQLTASIHKDFLMDIFQIMGEQANVKFLMKPKRWTFKHDIDPRLQAFLDQHRHQIQLLSPTINPQIAIQSCDLVVCFPFTSIFFAALQKGIPAIFYYPFADPGLKNITELQPFAIYGPDSLKQWVQQYLSHLSIPSDQDIKELCGKPRHAAIREQFVSSLKDVLYVN